MTQFQKSLAAPVALPAEPRTIRRGRFIITLIGLVMVAVAIGAGGVLLTEQIQPTVPPSIDAANVTDGWFPAISAANEARRLEAARQAVDGWSVRLLVPTVDQEVRDGWSSRYLVSDDD